MRISDWSSDVCSSDLGAFCVQAARASARGSSSSVLFMPGTPCGGMLPTRGRAGRGCSAGGRGDGGHQQQQRRAQRHAVHGERGEAVRLDVAQQPFDRDEGGEDRKSVVSGRSGSVRVDLGGRRILKKKKK